MTTGGNTIAPDLTGRRREFRAALALAGSTVAAFARELGVSHNHINSVLRGERTSKRITDAVELFVRRHTKY